MLLKVTSLFVPARQWLVRRKFRGRDDFQGEIVAPSREFFYTIAVSHLFFEPVSVVPVNFGVGSELIVALEFRIRRIKITKNEGIGIVKLS